MKRFVLVVLSAALLAGCAGIDGPPPADVREVELGDVRELLGSGDPIAALGVLDTLERVGRTDPTARGELREQALESMDGLFRGALAAKDFGTALSLALSRDALGLTPFIGEGGVSWDRAALLGWAARESLAGGPEVLAVYYGLLYAAAVGVENVLPREREAFLAALVSLKDPAALRHARRELTLAPDAGSTGSAALADAMKGTVTVLVDQGLKISNRVGLPSWIQGSGFFVSPNGYILTNYHVIRSEVDPEYEGFSRLYVSRSDSDTERFPAKVVGFDPILDLALLKVEVTSEYAFYPGLETDLRPGDPIIAIGTPVSLVRTISSGIVSAVGRRFLQLGDAMQIDVPVNPGNSGGPLLDGERRLVGVVFAGLEQYEGLNFAIPNGWIARILPRLFAGGKVTYGWIAASVAETTGGLEVVYTLPGGPAAQAGILEGDVLTRVGGLEGGDLSQVQGTLMQIDPPGLVRVEWLRGTERMSAVVALAERPDAPVEAALDRDTRDALLYPLFGLKLERVGQAFGKANYVVRRVLEGSQAAEIGLTPDDPLSIESWRVDEENKIAVVNMYVKKKSSGYLDGVVQLSAYLETDTFL